MKCMIKGCEQEWVDTKNGLTEMMWHVVVKHTPQDVNGRTLEKEEVRIARIE